MIFTETRSVTPTSYWLIEGVVAFESNTRNYNLWLDYFRNSKAEHTRIYYVDDDLLLKFRPKEITSVKGITFISINDVKSYDLAYDILKDKIHCVFISHKFIHTEVIACCLHQGYYGTNAKLSMNANFGNQYSVMRKINRNSERDIEIISNFKRPIVAIFSGDRDATYEFRPLVESVIKNLPKGSIVVHGGCQGIDMIADEYAKMYGYPTREYEVTDDDWIKYGKYAGPRRNVMMLMKEYPDVVYCFHPDIKYSRGTKNMIYESQKRGVKVFLYDLKTVDEM